MFLFLRMYYIYSHTLSKCLAQSLAKPFTKPFAQLFALGRSRLLLCEWQWCEECLYE